MGQELENEDKYELIPNPDTYEMSGRDHYNHRKFQQQSFARVCMALISGDTLHQTIVSGIDQEKANALRCNPRQ